MKEDLKDHVRAEYEQDPNGKKKVTVEASGSLAFALILMLFFGAYVFAVDRGIIHGSSTPKPIPSETNRKPDLRLP